MKFLTLDSALHRIARCILATALLLAPSLVAKAQDLDTITITGRVMDQNSAVIPGASVSAVLTKTGVTRTTTSDGEGRFRLIQLEPGTYTLKASFAGFRTQELPNLSFLSGQNVQLDFVLYPPEILVAPMVVTTEDVAPVDTTRTVVGGTI